MQVDPQKRSDIESPDPGGVKRHLPIREWWPDYDGGRALLDLRAGCFLTILVVPQAMAYAQLAELPASVGLRAALVAPLAYLALGTSRYLAVGPVAIVSLLVGEAIARTSSQTSTPPEQVAVTLGLLVGVFLLTLGLLRFGFLANFISSPVINGFVHAAAFIIAASQLPKLLGISSPPRDGSPLAGMLDLVPRFTEAQQPSLVLGAAALAVLLVARGPLGGLAEACRPVKRSFEHRFRDGAHAGRRGRNCRVVDHGPRESRRRRGRIAGYSVANTELASSRRRALALAGAERSRHLGHNFRDIAGSCSISRAAAPRESRPEPGNGRTRCQ